MSRMRQIPVMEVTQQEKVIHQNVPHPATPSCRLRRSRTMPAKFRLNDTPTLISNGCSSVREFCNNVQSITVDLNNLIGSVERVLPLLTTYLTALQARNMTTEPTINEQPPIDVAPASRPEPEQPPRPAQTAATPTPRPEDLQQLLENPLVKNLLTSFIQNTAAHG